MDESIILVRGLAITAAESLINFGIISYPHDLHVLIAKAIFLLEADLYDEN